MTISIVTHDAMAAAAAMQRRGNAVVIGGRTAGMLHERRELAFSATHGVRYVWRRFADVQDTAVTPDIPMDLPIADMKELRRIAAALRTVTSWRTGDLPTYERIHDILRQLPATLQGLPRPLLAHVIVGDGARLYVLAEVLRALPAG